MGRLRYIEPELWQNAELRRLGWVARQVFIFLFSCWADDEGRFKWDPLAILESAFSRSDPTDENGVAEALDGLAAAGMLLRYGKASEFGFILAWFLHQAMDKRYRRQSALPPPPVSVPSWAVADETRIAYAKHTEAKDQRQVTYRESIRWSAGNAAQLPRKSRAILAEVSRESRGSPALEVEVEVEVEGVNDNDQDLAPPATAEAALLEVEAAKTDKPRRKETEEQLAIRETFEQLTQLDWPGGTPEGYKVLMKEVVKREDGLLRRWAASGHDTTLPKGAKNRVLWYFTAAAEAMRRKFAWEPKSANDPSPQKQSWRGWPERFETEEGITSRWEEDELPIAAGSPDFYHFPLHNINGTEQQRLEKARRQHQRERDSAK